LQPYEKILHTYGVRPDDELKFITEAEHVHSSSEEYMQQFESLRTRLGMDANYG
jgi:hypothetical protein